MTQVCKKRWKTWSNRNLGRKTSFTFAIIFGRTPDLEIHGLLNAGFSALGANLVE